MAFRHTVLVVDDEPYVIHSVRDLLRLDYLVFTATGAPEGMDVLRREEIHVVMTDQRMPEMTGVEFLSQIRGAYPDAIRLLFTGYADVQTVIDAINQGNVFRYIAKPWDPDELQGIIRQACEHYDLIVERKKLLTQLQRQNQELEKANAELRETDEQKYAFLEVASHELRTPVAVILAAAYMAAGANAKPEDIRVHLGQIQQACRRLEYSVKQMTTILAARRLVPHIETRATDLPALLRQAAEDVRPFVEIRKQSLCLETDSGSVCINIDADKIRDSLIQLLMNAVKFTPDGGKITVSALRLSAGGIEIRVCDTGMGIAPECLPHVFDPGFIGFEKLRHSSGVFEFGCKGLGLGLCTAKAFVELHGGTISAQSELGQGSTFIVTLPGAPPVQQPAASAS